MQPDGLWVRVLAVSVSPSREWPQLWQDTRAFQQRLPAACVPGRPPTAAGLLFKAPRHRAQPLSHAVPCWGGCPTRRARWWVSWVGLPGWARASPSWPSLSGGQRPLYVRSEEAKQNNPALAPSSPSCPPPPFAVRGFPALSVTPGQLEGHEARGVGPWPEAGLWGQLRQALRAEGG